MQNLVLGDSWVLLSDTSQFTIRECLSTNVDFSIRVVDVQLFFLSLLRWQDQWTNEVAPVGASKTVSSANKLMPLFSNYGQARGDHASTDSCTRKKGPKCIFLSSGLKDSEISQG